MFKLEDRHQKVLSEPVKFAVLVPKCHRCKFSFKNHRRRKVKNAQSVKFLFPIFYSDQYTGIMKWKEITMVKYELTINKTSKPFL